jgi:hypothetical protein
MEANIKTLKELSRIMDYRGEIKVLNARLNKLHKSGDLVVDYAKDYSTGKARAITLRGAASEDDIRRTKTIARIHELEGLILESAKYIDTVPDIRVRTLLTLRYLDGKTWGEAAKLLYKKMSASAARMCVVRYFEAI